MDDEHAAAAAAPPSRGFLAPPPGAVPSDRCVRCGAVTPAGVALCEMHNPGRVRGPSATQMHATVLGGVLLGVVGLLLIWRLGADAGAPFRVELLGAGADPSGGVALAFAIVNEADASRVADCRVTRDGVARPDDLAFRTERLAPAERVLVEKVVPAPVLGTVAYDLDRLSVACL
jgi:hypothetical protein